MIRLYKIDNGKFMIYDKRFDSRTIVSTEAAAIQLLGTMGVYPEEVEIAFDELGKTEHDYAEFGTLGYFVKTDEVPLARTG